MPPEASLRFKIFNLLTNFGKMLGCYFLFFILLAALQSTFPSFDYDKYQQTEIFELLKTQPWKFAFMAAIFAPIMEEGLFRSLLKPTEFSLKFFFCCVLFMIGIAIIPEEAHWSLKYGVLGGTLLLAFYALGELIPEHIFRKTCYWLHRYYLINWILGAIIFGFVHIFNYVDTFQIDLVLFIMIFPRIIAGFFFGKIKLENRGLIWPMLMHSMNNSMVLLFILPLSLSN